MHIFVCRHFYTSENSWFNGNIQGFTDGILRSTSRHPKNAKHNSLTLSLNFVILDTLDLLSLKLFSSSSQHFFLIWEGLQKRQLISVRKHTPKRSLAHRQLYKKKPTFLRENRALRKLQHEIVDLILSRCKYLFMNNSNNLFIYSKNYNYIHL